jgi:hypothetical protein
MHACVPPDNLNMQLLFLPANRKQSRSKQRSTNPHKVYERKGTGIVHESIRKMELGPNSIVACADTRVLV